MSAEALARVIRAAHQGRQERRGIVSGCLVEVLARGWQDWQRVFINPGRSAGAGQIVGGCLRTLWPGPPVTGGIVAGVNAERSLLMLTLSSGFITLADWWRLPYQG